MSAVPPKRRPCGLPAEYDDCCGRFIEGRALPENPESLMRSRYTAFTQANVQYIRRTMQGKPLKNFNLRMTQDWASRVTWLGLTVHTSEVVGNRGTVSFCARFDDNGVPGDITEVSQFYRAGGVWYYTGI